MHNFQAGLRAVHQRLLAPHSSDENDRRHEYILNVLLLVLFSLATLAMIIDGSEYLWFSDAYDDGSLLSSGIFIGLTLSLYILSRRGAFKLATYLFMLVLAAAATQLMLAWSFALTAEELAFAMVIVVASIMLAGREALIFALLTVVVVMVVGNLSFTHSLIPQPHWYGKTWLFGDDIGYGGAFAFIGLVSWLSNREIERSLKRVRQSEAALQQERDGLELKVAARTRELEQLQLARLVELQRFAEFGRLSAGLLHEVANPLTAASLNLEQLSRQQQSELVRQLRHNLRHLERYVAAARKQLQGGGQAVVFSVRAELTQLTKLLQPKANKAGVKLLLVQTGNFRLRGDAVKFSQLFANLIANAIDAYNKGRANERLVTIRVKRLDSGLSISVEDRGQGVSAADRRKLFDPFFSTKAPDKRGLGIGLAIVKQYVEDDFDGRIVVNSSAGAGTSFVVSFPENRLAGQPGTGQKALQSLPAVSYLES